MAMRSAVIATIKTWNISRAEELRKKFSQEWDITLVTNKEQLSFKALSSIRPEYIFFPHWSWLIPKQIYSEFKCVVFHMTDLPFGRGGSPLQNLILRGIGKTKISALKVGKGMDTGPVYLKRELDISIGSADKILDRASGIVFNDMIPEFLSGKVDEPKPQEGKVVEFLRRKPQDGDIMRAGIKTQQNIYDFIRMLDGEGYPRAYLELGDMRMEFMGVREQNGELEGIFRVKKNDKK